MSGKIYVWLLITVLLITAPVAAAQQPTKIPANFVLVLTSPVIHPYRIQIADLALKNRLPVILDPRIRRGRRAHEL